VPPMAVPEAGAGLAAGLAAGYDAVALFAERAAARGAGLDPAGWAAAAEISRAAGGLPQAIELAAARADVLAPGQIAASLGGRLAGPDAAGGQVLRAAIGWSHDLLTAAEQVLLRRLSVFAGWSLETAERVCGGGDLPAAAVLRGLARLADAALIEAEPDGQGGRRYRMPGSVRRYAAGQLEKAGETAAVRRRLRDCVLSDVEYPASIGAAEVPASWQVVVGAFARYDAGNVRVVLGWCLEQGDIEAGLRICAATVWPVRWAAAAGTLAEWAGWLDVFLAADQSGVPAPVRGAALTCRAQIALVGGDDERAESWASEGVPMCGPAGGWRFAAMGQSVLVEAALRAGRTEVALSRADEALAQPWRPGDEVRHGFICGSRAVALTAAGRLAEAQEAAQTALGLMLKADHQYGAAVIRLGLGGLSRLRRDFDAALGYYLEALPALRKAAAGPETARCLAGLGRLAAWRGDLGEAREYLAEGLRLSLASGSRDGIARGLSALAALAAAEGRPGRAVELAGAVTALRAAAGLGAKPAAWARRYRDGAAGLGAAEVDRLWASGLELTSSAAAELALEPGGASRGG
jgi:tetratricopeptide (TPR) repeat protein